MIHDFSYIFSKYMQLEYPDVAVMCLSFQTVAAASNMILIEIH